VVLEVLGVLEPLAPLMMARVVMENSACTGFKRGYFSAEDTDKIQRLCARSGKATNLNPWNYRTRSTSSNP
jgi:hypothetical protein